MNLGQVECRGHLEVASEWLMMSSTVWREERTLKVPKLLELEEDRTVLVEIQGSLLHHSCCMVNVVIINLLSA